MRLSKVNYFLIFVAVVTSIENLIYFNVANLPEILGYLVLVIVPLTIFIKKVYDENMRIIDNHISKVIYLSLQILLTLILVAQFTYLIDSLSWLITGDPAVINNISNFGFWFVGVVFLIAASNLANKQTIIKNTSAILGFFNIFLIPILLLYIITSSYTGVLHEYLIGHIDVSFKQFFELLPLISILLIARSNPEEEKKISQMLIPGIAWMIMLYVLSIFAISSLTTADIAYSSTYFTDFFESLRKAHVFNVYNYNFTSVLALYKFINSVLLIMLLIVIKNGLYDKSYVYIRPSEYLKEVDARAVFLVRKRRRTLIIFSLIMLMVVLLSPSLYQLNVLVTRVSTLAVLVLNALAVSMMANNIINNKNALRSTKLIGLYSAVISIIILILYIVL